MLVQDFTSASRSPWANLFYVFQLCPSWKQLGLDIVFNLWIFRNSLVFQIAPVCGLSMLHFPAQVLYLCFQLCLLVFKLKLMNYQIKHFRESWKSWTYQFFPGTGLYVVGVGICVLKRVSEEVSFEASHVRYQSSKVRPFRLFALRAAGVVM